MRRLGVIIVCALALPAASAQAWTWPVEGPVLRPFVFDPAHPYAGGQHRGIDIGGVAGTSIRAPADGVVSFAGTVPTGGKTVSIETSLGYTATLLHLGSIAVKRGASVVEGDGRGDCRIVGRYATVRLLRRPRVERAAGLCRSAHVVAGAADRRRGGIRADKRAGGRAAGGRTGIRAESVVFVVSSAARRSGGGRGDDLRRGAWRATG